MAELKTKVTVVDPDQFLAAIKDERKREDAKTVRAIMQRVSGEEPRMWGPSILGFGSYHYKYESGREGDMCAIGFSPRAAALTLYVLTGFPGQADLLESLGKHSTGKSCLYIKKLADVDLVALEAIVAGAWKHVLQGLRHAEPWP